MRRVVTAVLVALALTIGAAAPVSGQEDGVLEINPTEGSPGDLVTGLVDPQVVAENCITTIEETQALFLAGPLEPGPVLQAWLDSGHLIGIPTNDPVEWATALLFPQFNVEPFPQTFEVTAALLMFAAMVEGVGQDDEVTADFLAQTFVLTFADIATQEPVGELANFDPDSGFGQVNVPEVDPGLWAVAATCVIPVVTDESFLAAVAVGAAWLEDHDVPHRDELGVGVFWTDPDGQEHHLTAGIDLAAFVTPWVAPEMFPVLMEPQEGAGPWVETFCVDCEPPFSQDLLDQFCGVLPEIQAVPDQLAALFGGVDIDDPDTYPSVEALEAFVTNVATLLELGDTSVPPAVAPQWSIATAELRELVFGLTAVGFDFALLVDLSPDDAARLVEVGSGEGEPNPEFDAAVEVLTAFFVDNCVPGEGAPPTAPTAPVARFTG